MFSKTAEEVAETFVKRKDFREWWLTANENISSSKSGAHFGYYKAAAHSDSLSALHTAKLNLALETGTPLERWGHGLTVLLEKEFGAIYLDKLWAICLFEADFNWLQKLIFSKRMVTDARKNGLIPPEQCATSGVDQNQGTMLKVFHNDIHRTMYIPFAIVSADLSHCYDAVHHAVSCIALRSFGVPNLAIGLVLTCLQMMFFWLRTAFGVSQSPFNGTAENPFFGLAQGSGFAPPTFQAVSTLMINAYKSMGNDCTYVSPVTLTAFSLAAILFVDDTDLLMRAPTHETTNEEFFCQIQDSLNDWSSLVMATGGSIKQKKSYVSVNSYAYRKGKAVLKTKRSLPRKAFTIPQKDSVNVPIPLLDPSERRKTLGMYTNTEGTSSEQLRSMKKRGAEWVSNVKPNKFIKPADGWLSYEIQLKPKIEWGLTCVCAPPTNMDKAMGSIQHSALSHLGVSQKIHKAVRTMPEMFGGLGMWDVNPDCPSKKVYFMRRHWKTVGRWDS